MARRPEEEENHWPGFVDALSTIVMVVTFLLIILVVVIVVISFQINPETSAAASEAQAQAQQAEAEAQQSQARAEANAQALAQAEAQMEAQAQSEAEALAQAQARLQAVAEAQARAQAEAQAQAQAKAQAEAQLEQTRQSLEVASVQIAALQQQLESVSQIADQQTQVIEATQQQIELKNQTIRELAQKVQAAPVSDLGDTAEVQAPTPVNEIEITVPRVDAQVVPDQLRSDVETASAVMTVKFEANALEMNQESRDEAQAFLTENGAVDGSNRIEAIAYYDGNTLSISQAKRTAYFRLLAVRNTLIDSGIDGQRIVINVRAAPDSGDGPGLAG
ncbi:MAG TPA: hypothetical protein ENJ68_00185, partial [Devosia sp.]|nr:hypothetical protein [Devosia sp.]